MNTFVISFFVIATAEMADKTQLLALFLASRFKRPLPIIGGMCCALLLSQTVAALMGRWLSNLVQGNTLHILLGLSLFAAALWAFLPNKMDEPPEENQSSHGIFATAFISFIMAEIGDKTQIATTALAAQFHTLLPVVLGTVLGITAINSPTIVLGHMVADKLPLKWIRAVSGLLFAALGVYELRKII